jgi:hypothetical protein
MKESKYFPPILGEAEYHCPFCRVYAQQFYANLSAHSHWQLSSDLVTSQAGFNGSIAHEWVATKCQRCNEVAFWNEKRLIYPKISIAPPPNIDLAEDIQNDYQEAASILSDSPRAAAALLRLALQKLCKQLGEKGENINDDIKNLVTKGLNPLVQKSLDTLRIAGNNAVHPGEIDLFEEPERVVKLFDLINFIAAKMITEPKEIEGFYDSLPRESLAAIEKRDQKK